MSFTMVALSWDMTCRDELVSRGFRPHEVLVRYPDLPPTDQGEREGTRQVFALKPEIPLQFAVVPYWEKGEKAGIVQVVMISRPGMENFFLAIGFKKVVILAKYGAPGPTAEVTLKNQQEFLDMSFPPNRWYAGSYWGAGPG